MQKRKTYTSANSNFFWRLFPHVFKFLFNSFSLLDLCFFALESVYLPFSDPLCQLTTVLMTLAAVYLLPIHSSIFHVIIFINNKCCKTQIESRKCTAVIKTFAENIILERKENL